MRGDIRNQAEALAVGLDVGGTSVAEVVAWAEGVIAALDSAHWSICEVATMGSTYPQDVANALRAIPGDFDRDWVEVEVIAALARGLASDRRRADRIASALYELALADRLHDGALEATAWWAWDALSLADDGVLEQTRDQVIDEMIAALTSAAATTALPPP